MIKEKPLLEVCVDSIESALDGVAGGADRIELCAGLTEGGTTPSAGLLSVLKRKIFIPVNVMLRPRRGDFVYSEAEFEVMKQDLEIAKSMGADGIVFGTLHEDGKIDIEKATELINLAGKMDITFHRAFDLVVDPVNAMEELISIGVKRILTSGQKATALQGVELLSQLVEKGKGRIIIMPGGGVSEENVKYIMESAGTHEFHVSGKRLKKGKVPSSSESVYFGASEKLNEEDYFQTDQLKVKKIKQELTKL